jgi:hypothetical protein
MNYFQHKDNFANLTRKDTIETEGLDVIHAIITDNGDYTVILCKPH